jgi:hypothetical protein
VRTIRRAIIAVGALGFSLTAAACDDGDPEADGSTTATPPAPPSPPTTATSTPPTTAPSVVANTDPPTTTAPATSTRAPATTIDEEALKAEIAEDFVASLERLADLTGEPNADVLDERIAQIAAPGEYREELSTYVTGLAEAGQHVRLGDPPVFEVTVEQVAVIGPFEAEVQFCWAQNGQVVQPGAESGDTELTVSPPTLTAVRDRETVVRTAHGWLQSTSDGRALGIFEGSAVCPPE